MILQQQIHFCPKYNKGEHILEAALRGVFLKRFSANLQ